MKSKNKYCIFLGIDYGIRSGFATYDVITNIVSTFIIKIDINNLDKIYPMFLKKKLKG